MAQDTRKDPRAKVLAMTVRYKSATIDEFIEHHSHDVSRGGMFIKTPNPFPPGTLLKFEIRIKDEEAVLAGVGRVVWKRETAQASNDLPAGMGVKFIKIDEKSKAVISRLVEAHRGAQGAYEAGKPADYASSAPPPPAAARPRPAPAAAAGAGAAAAAVASDITKPPPPSVPPVPTTTTKRHATMLGLGGLPPRPGGSSEPTPPSSPVPPPVPKAAPSEPAGTFFPKTDPERDMPPPEERTVMKQAAELLKQALAEAGGSLEEIGTPAAEPAPAKPATNGEAAAAKVDAPAPTPVAPAPAEPEPPAPAKHDEPAGGHIAAEIAETLEAHSSLDRPTDDVAVEPAAAANANGTGIDPALVEPIGAEPDLLGAAARSPDEKPVAAKFVPKPAVRAEESGGSGRMLSWALLVVAVIGGVYLFFANKPPEESPAAPTEPRRAATTSPAATAQPAAAAVTTVVPAAATVAPSAEASAAAGASSAQAGSPQASAAPTAEPAAPPEPKVTAEAVAPKPAPKEPKAAEPKPVAAHPPQPKPAAPKPAAPVEPKPAPKPAAPKPAPEPKSGSGDIYD